MSPMCFVRVSFPVLSLLKEFKAIVIETKVHIVMEIFSYAKI